MMSRQELKKNAKAVAFSNLGKFWIAFIIVIIVGAIFEGIGEAMFPKNQIVSYVLAGLIGWLTLGYNKNILSISRGETFTISDMFGYIKYFFQAFIYTLVHSVATLLIYAVFGVVGGILAFIILPFAPFVSIIIGVIAFLLATTFVFRLALAYLIMADTPTKDPVAVLKESNELMKGHINQLVILILSFIGWWFLVMITIGIAAIWVIPYIAITMAMYYDELKKLNNPVAESVQFVEPNLQPVQPVTFVEPTVQAVVQPVQPVAFVEPTVQPVQPVAFVEPTVQPVQPAVFVEPAVAPVAEPVTPVNDPTNPII